jgi:hypothetical protein
MLTKADDFPVHQLPEPIATSGTDRNFYDRYFFNGYTPDGRVFFAAALGVYPHLNVMDASFSAIVDGVQHNLRASRLLNSERMDTRVGPISVEVIEPLKRLRVTVSDNAHGIAAELVFEARAPAVEEPRFTFRQGPRTMMDYTRLTQNGTYDGFISVGGKRIEIDRSMVVGTRDRSWGVRPIGLSDPQGLAPPRPPQFYWLWSPLNFPDRFMLYHINAEASGRPWNTASVIGALGDEAPLHMTSCASQISYKSGTRHAKSAAIETVDANGGKWRAELTPHFNFYMSGIGYMHPEWGHGHWKGENALGYDAYDLATVNENDPRFWHVQAFVTATLSGPGVERHGAGVLEQLVIGAHAPSGFKELMDTAP